VGADHHQPGHRCRSAVALESSRSILTTERTFTTVDIGRPAGGGCQCGTESVDGVEGVFVVGW
jgi:hypothetical protein